MNLTCKQCASGFEAENHTRFCGDCRLTRKSAVSAKRYIANREHRLAAAAEYRAANKDAVKIRIKNWYKANRERNKKTQDAWREANPDKVMMHARASSHNRRALGFGNISKATRAAINESLESYRIGNMYWDVYGCELIEKPTIDHIVPLVSGGSNDSENLAPTSRSLNCSKNDKPLIVWMAEGATS